MSEIKRPAVKLTEAQRSTLLWAKRKYEDGRVPPYIFRDYRSILILLKAGVIEYRSDYGVRMYRLTHKGLDVLGDL